MASKNHIPDRQRAAFVAALACLALVLGALVYITDRPPSQAPLIPTVAALAGSHLFGALGQWLPSFVHPFAFSLLTAVALSARASPAYGACLLWCAVNVAFECGQHPAFKAGLADLIGSDLGQMPPLHALALYFFRGTFDIGDIAAAIGGALAAAAVLRGIHRQKETGHAH